MASNPTSPLPDGRVTRVVKVLDHIFIHGHVLAAIIEGGILAGLLFWIGAHLQNKAESHKRKADLIPKVLHDGQNSIAVLVSLRTNEVWLKQHLKRGDRDEETGRSREDKQRLRDDLYKLYAQGPQIEGICIEVRMVFETPKVRKAAAELEDLVLNRILTCEDEKEIQWFVTEKAEPMLKDLVKFMEDEVNAR